MYQFTADASKGYMSVIWRLVLLTFLEDWGSVSLPPIFRYARFYRLLQINVIRGASCSENSNNNLCTIPSGPAALWIFVILVIWWPQAQWWYSFARIQMDCVPYQLNCWWFFIITDLNWSFSTFLFPSKQKLICHPLRVVQHHRSLFDSLNHGTGVSCFICLDLGQLDLLYNF